MSPLDLSRPLSYASLSVLVPTVCSVIVLIVILLVAFLVVCKKRTPAFDEMMPAHHEQMCSMREERLLSEGNILSVMSDHQRKESCLSELAETPSKLYFPSPYAMNQLEASFKQHRLLDAANSAAGHGDGSQGAGHGLGPAGQGNFERMTLEHTYDIPLPPKWV